MIDYSKLPPESAAAYLYAEGMGHESNPFPKNTNERLDFALAMGKLQDQEYKKMLKEWEAR